jgi:hypothetical protein
MAQADNFFLFSAPIHGLEANDSRIYDMYSQYGPTPRICFGFLISKSLFDDHKRDKETALSLLSLNTLQKMANRCSGVTLVKAGSDDTYGETSHTIILVKRCGDEWSRCTVEPITRNVGMALQDRLRSEVRDDRLRLYHYLANSEGSRSLAGVVYESLIQEDLRKSPSFHLNLVTMSRRQVKNARWRCNHVGATSQTEVISRTRNDAFTSRPAVIFPNVYYAPRHRNQAAFDSFISTGQQLFIFQFTISSGYDINKGITDFFSQESLPPRRNWHFVFVIPSTSEEVSCPHSEDDDMIAFLNEVHLCSVRIDPRSPDEV